MKFVRCICAVICITMIALTAITSSFAWYVDYIVAHSESEFSGASVIAYFYSGTGTEDDPYVINTSNHLYNLAWLQNAGVFGNTVTYFKLADANGNPVTSVYKVSVEAYGKGQLTGARADVVVAMMRYGDSVAAL